MENKQNGYVGHIGHGGSMYVPAPNKPDKRTGGKKLEGTDLRTGTGAKKSK